MEIAIHPFATGSFELESNMNQLGQFLIEIDQNKVYTQKITKCKDISFVEGFVVELLFDLKIDLNSCIYLSRVKSSGTEILSLPDNCSSEQRKSIYKYSSLFSLKLEKRNSDFSLIEKVKSVLYNLKSNVKEVLSRSRFKTVDHYSKIDIIFSSRYPNNVHVLSPIAQYLKRNKKMSSLYISNRADTLNIVKNKYDIDVAFIENIKNNEIDISGLMQFLGLVSVRVSDHWGFTSQVIEKLLFERLKKYFMISFGFYKKYVACINKLQPKGIVLCTSGSVDSRILILLCKLMKIPNYVVMHGATREGPIMNLGLGDNHFVWSAMQAASFNKYNPQIKYFAFGSPKHDLLIGRLKSAPPPQVIDGPYILFPTTPPNNNLIDTKYYRRGRWE